MSGLQDALQNAVRLLEAAGIDYMVIGGYALPHFGRTRSTLDLDIAVRIEDEASYDRFLRVAEEHGYTLSICGFSNPVTLLVDRKVGLEVEFWTRPDGVEWGEEALRKRLRREYAGQGFWVISPEDFIVSKLARPDREAEDEADVASVITRMSGRLDEKYLMSRAERFGVWSLLEQIVARL